jgi:hypothetical protein
MSKGFVASPAHVPNRQQITKRICCNHSRNNPKEMDNVPPASHLKKWFHFYDNGHFRPLYRFMKNWTWKDLKRFKEEDFLKVFPDEEKLLALEFYKLFVANSEPPSFLPQTSDSNSTLISPQRETIILRRVEILDDMFDFLADDKKPSVSQFIQSDPSKLFEFKALDFSQNELCGSKSFAKLVEFLCKLPVLEYVDFSSNRLRAEQKCWSALTQLLKQKSIKYVNIT